MMPFTVEQFFGVFAAYNRAIGPLRWVLIGLALTVVVLAFGSSRSRDRVITGVLATLWLWMGVVYHLAFFRAINPAAFVFGAAFVVQGVLFLRAGRQLRFGVRNDVNGWVGGAFALYAFVLYPALGWLAGHSYPAAPTFGAPCPTTIFTFAVLLWADSRVPGHLLVIPALWSVLGLSAALQLGVVQDLGLIVAGVLGTVLIVARNRRRVLSGRLAPPAVPARPRSRRSGSEGTPRAGASHGR